MNEDIGLLSDILEHPHDDTPRLVYADWLEDRSAPGDPARAAFIRLQIESARATNPDLARREKAMLTQYGRLWSRDLRPALSKLTWRRGFVEAASVFASVFLEAPHEILSLAPLRRLRFRDPSGLMASLSRCTHVGRLDGLSFNGGRLAAADIQPLASSPYIETLRELDLGGNEVSGPRLQHLLDRLPALESLGLAGVGLSNVGLVQVIGGLPRGLTALDVEANDLDDRCLGLFDRHAQRLRRLALGRNRITVDGLNHLLGTMPELEALAAGPQSRSIREQLTKDYPGVAFQFGHAAGMGGVTGPRATAVVFPFDLFGSAGAAAGAELLADELREIVADNKRETVVTRAGAYGDRLRLRETTFATLADYEGWREKGRGLARKALRDGDFLLWLTGNHLGALPVYDELAALDDPPLVLQLDAHLDIHHFRDCSAEPTHGNFLLHVAGTLPPLINVGHRDLLLPVEYVAGHYRQTYGAAEFAIAPERLSGVVADHVKRASRVVLDLDCDVFDPAFFPGVARPVPFGLTPTQVLAVIGAIDRKKLAGVIVSEFDPGRDEKDRSLAALGWLIEYLLLTKYE